MQESVPSSLPLVDRLCNELFLTHRARESDNNLAFVRNRLLKSEVDLAALLELYGRMRAGKRVPDDETNPLCSVVKLSGVARVEGGLLKVRNRIYEHVFDRSWVVTHLPDADLQRQRSAYRRGLFRALAGSGIVLAIMAMLLVNAYNNARRARAGERRADQSAAEARRLTYVADMTAIGANAAANYFGAVRELVQETRDSPYRGFEWGYWNRLAHQELLTLKGHTGGITLVEYSPDGRQIVTSSLDGTARIWDAQTGHLIRMMRGYAQDIDSAAGSRDGRYLVQWGNNPAITLWDGQFGIVGAADLTLKS